MRIELHLNWHLKGHTSLHTQAYNSSHDQLPQNSSKRDSQAPTHSATMQAKGKKEPSPFGSHLYGKKASLGATTFSAGGGEDGEGQQPEVGEQGDGGEQGMMEPGNTHLCFLSFAAAVLPFFCCGCVEAHKFADCSGALFLCHFPGPFSCKYSMQETDAKLLLQLAFCACRHVPHPATIHGWHCIPGPNWHVHEQNRVSALHCPDMCWLQL